MQSTSFADNQTEQVTGAPVDSAGKPAPALATPPTWVSQDPTVVTVGTPDPTGLINTLTAVAPGVTTVSLNGVGSGGGTFFTQFQVTITGGPAVGFTFTFGAPA